MLDWLDYLRCHMFGEASYGKYSNKNCELELIEDLLKRQSIWAPNTYETCLMWIGCAIQDCTTLQKLQLRYLLLLLLELWKGYCWPNIHNSVEYQLSSDSFADILMPMTMRLGPVVLLVVNETFVPQEFLLDPSTSQTIGRANGRCFDILVSVYLTLIR